MLSIVPSFSDAALSQARNLFREYATIPGVAPCVEDFEREVVSLPGLYAPAAGRLLLAVDDSAGNPGETVGCVALRKLEPGDVCEMKRLYVRPPVSREGRRAGTVRIAVAEARRSATRPCSWTRCLP